MKFPRRIYCRREPDGQLAFSETLLAFRGRDETIAVYVLESAEKFVNLEVTKQGSPER